MRWSFFLISSVGAVVVTKILELHHMGVFLFYTICPMSIFFKNILEFKERFLIFFFFKIFFENILEIKKRFLNFFFFFQHIFKKYSRGSRKILKNFFFSKIFF